MFEAGALGLHILQARVAIGEEEGELFRVRLCPCEGELVLGLGEDVLAAIAGGELAGCTQERAIQGQGLGAGGCRRHAVCRTNRVLRAFGCPEGGLTWVQKE